MNRQLLMTQILVLMLLTSCKVKPLVGEYIQCGFSCFKLEIHSDSSYSMKIPVEIGDPRTAYGKWTLNSKKITLTPTLDSFYSFDKITNDIIYYVDSIRVRANLTKYEYLTITFEIGTNSLDEITKPKTMNYCNFIRLSNDTILNEKRIKRSQERCFRKSKQSYNKMVRQSKNAL